MKAKVFHKNELGQFTQVALVDLSAAEFDNMSAEDALEYAWRWTQNLAGSWSMKLAEDANDLVTVTADLHRVDGKVYGLRSSDLGDIIQIEDSVLTDANGSYTVEAVGFKKVEVVI